MDSNTSATAPAPGSRPPPPPPPRELVPEFYKAGKLTVEPALIDTAPKATPKHVAIAKWQSFDGIYVFHNRTRPDMGYWVFGHAEPRAGAFMQEAQLSFFAQKEFHSYMRFSIDIQKTDLPSVPGNIIPKEHMRSYEMYLGSKMARDEALFIIPHGSVADDDKWKQKPVVEILKSASKQKISQEYDWVDICWRRKQLQLYTFAFSPEKISFGGTFQSHQADRSYQHIETFFNKVLNNEKYKGDRFEVFFVMKNFTTGRGKKLEYSPIFKNALLRFQKRVLEESRIIPACRFWNNQSNLFRMKKGIIKKIADQPQIEFPRFDSYPFYDPFITQLCVAICNEEMLEEERYRLCLKTRVEVRLVRFAKEVHGVFAGLVRLPQGFPVSIQEDDRFGVLFEGVSGGEWTARVTAWNGSTRGLITDLQVVLTAPLESEAVDTDSKTETYFVNEGRPKHIFSVEDLDRNDPAAVQRYQTFLENGPCNNAFLIIKPNNKVHKTNTKAVSILNLYNTSKLDQREIANKFKDVLLGQNALASSARLDFYPASYDIVVETTSPKLEILQAATGRARNVANFKFEEEQLNVVRAVGATGQITLLQGGAGTSKSEIEDAIVVHAVKAGLKVIVACPQNVIADNVVVSIQRVLNETVPQARASRWVSQESQISHLKYVARGQTEFDYWRLPEISTGDHSEEANEIADSIRNIHRLTHGTTDKRFKAVDYIPIHRFAVDEGIVDYQVESSRGLSKRPASVSQSSIKPRLDAQKMQEPAQSDPVQDLKITKAKCEAELERLLEQIKALKELNRLEIEAAAMEQKGEIVDKTYDSLVLAKALGDNKERPSISSVKKQRLLQTNLVKDLEKKIIEAEQVKNTKVHNQDDLQDESEAVRSDNEAPEVEDNISRPQTGSEKDWKITQVGNFEDEEDDIAQEACRSQASGREISHAEAEAWTTIGGMQAAMILTNNDGAQRDRGKLLHLCQKINSRALTEEEAVSFNFYTKNVLVNELESSDTKVLVTTTFNLSDSSIQRFKADLIIVTEAQQSNMLGAMYCFAFHPNAHYLFSGDPMQEGVIEPDVRMNQAAGMLQKNLLSWLIDHGRRPLRLNLGYRQEATLCNMVSECAYDSKITPAPSTFRMHGSDVIRQFLATTFRLPSSIPCAIIDLHDTEEASMDHTNSVYNPKSADYAMTLALKLAPLVGTEKITILTSYKAQKTLLEKIIMDNQELNGIKISTVRGYLSSQNDVIIYDHARSSKMGFTASSKHWRVILSRARHGLFLLLNRAPLRAELHKLKVYKNVEAYLEKKGQICSWPFGAPENFSSVINTRL